MQNKSASVKPVSVDAIGTINYPSAKFERTAIVAGIIFTLLTIISMTTSVAKALFLLACVLLICAVYFIGRHISVIKAWIARYPYIQTALHFSLVILGVIGGFVISSLVRA